MSGQSPVKPPDAPIPAVLRQGEQVIVAPAPDIDLLSGLCQ